MTLDEAMTADMTDGDRLRVVWSIAGHRMACREDHSSDDVFRAGHCGRACVDREQAAGHGDARLVVESMGRHGARYREVGGLALQ